MSVETKFWRPFGEVWFLAAIVGCISPVLTALGGDITRSNLIQASSLLLLSEQPSITYIQSERRPWY